MERKAEFRLHLAVLRVEQVPQHVEALQRFGKLGDGAKTFGEFDNLCAACGKCDADIALQCRTVETWQGPESGYRRLRGFAGRETERRSKCRIDTALAAGLFEKCLNGGAVGDDCCQQLFEPGIVGEIENGRKGFRQFAILLACRGCEVCAAGIGKKRRGSTVVEHREMTGNIGFERKLVQQRFAEGVDRLNLQPARRFQCPGKQAPRFLAFQEIRPLALDRRNPVIQRLVIERHPFGQSFEDAVGHFRRSSLGIGQAENGRRPAAG